MYRKVYICGIEMSQRIHFWYQISRVPTETSDQEISADVPGKEKQGKKGK